MKKLFDNIKAPITSLIGLAISIVTILSIYQGNISWQYEGLIGVSVGILFFLIPDKVVNLMLATFKKIIDKPKE